MLDNDGNSMFPAFETKIFTHASNHPQFRGTITDNSCLSILVMFRLKHKVYLQIERSNMVRYDMYTFEIFSPNSETMQCGTGPIVSI